MAGATSAEQKPDSMGIKVVQPSLPYLAESLALAPRPADCSLRNMGPN